MRGRRAHAVPHVPLSLPMCSKWINSCVGWGNYRAFLQLCVYLTAAAVYSLLLLLSMDARLVSMALGGEEAGSSAVAAAAGAGSAEAAAALPPDVPLALRLGWRGPFAVHAAAQVGCHHCRHTVPMSDRCQPVLSCP